MSLYTRYWWNRNKYKSEHGGNIFSKLKNVVTLVVTCVDIVTQENSAFSQMFTINIRELAEGCDMDIYLYL